MQSETSLAGPRVRPRGRGRHPAVPDLDASKAKTPARILVVEDDALVRMPLTDALREAGYVVVETSTADAAWRFLATDQHIDLLISDIRTPGGIDGLDLARRLSAKLPHIPVILTTGFNPRAQESAAFQVLRKPYDMDDLLDLVARRLDQPSRLS
jgi:DNA-binding NtrC family response regulator